MALALVYVRQSRHKEGERTASPEVQEAECRRLAAVAACDEVEVFADLDLSGGKTGKRAGLAALLRRLDAGGVAVVAAYDQSRAFRNTRDALDFFARMEKLPDVEVAFVHGRFDRTPVGGFSYTVLSAAHEMERRMSGDKVRAAYAYRNARGEATGQPPYGYRRAGAGSLEVVEDEAAVVRRIFADYSAGTVTAQALAARLNDEGVARARARSRFGWLPDTVVDVLRNVAYVGQTYTKSRGRREGDLIAAAWPGIVAPATFDRCADLLKGRRRGGRGGLGRAYAFKGLLVCSECTGIMRSNRGKGGVYYRCRRDVGERCRAAGVPEARLLAWGDALFEGIDALRPSDFGDVVEAAASKRQATAGSLAAIDDTLGRLGKRFDWGLIEEADYLAEVARLRAMRGQLEAQASAGPAVLQLDGVGRLWSTGTPEERRGLLGVLFDRLYVTDGAIGAYVGRREYRALVEELVGRVCTLAEREGSRSASVHTTRRVPGRPPATYAATLVGLRAVAG